MSNRVTNNSQIDADSFLNLHPSTAFEQRRLITPTVKQTKIILQTNILPPSSNLSN